MACLSVLSACSDKAQPREHAAKASDAGVHPTMEAAAPTPDDAGSSFERVWFDSSVAIEVSTFRSFYGPGTPSSTSTCYHWDRSSLTAEELSHLSQLRLVPLSNPCGYDAVEYVTVTVISANGSRADYPEQSSFGRGCVGNEPAPPSPMLPEGTNYFLSREESSPCE